MQVTFNSTTYSNVSMGHSSKKNQSRQSISQLLKPLEVDSKAIIPSLQLMKGINPNSSDVFDAFTKIDDATRKVNFTLSQDAWIDCLKSEIQEFSSARKAYEKEKSLYNHEHMIEEMGDILYTAASIAKDSGIDPKEAFKTTNRKFYNRMSLMERLALEDNKGLATSAKYEKRAWWESAKKNLYGANAVRHAKQESTFNANA